MPKKIDISGMTFGHWYVNKENGHKKSRIVWDCTCLICGNHYDVDGSTLRNGTSTMCHTCSLKENNIGFRKDNHPLKTHGLGASKIYSVLYNMHKRCEDPTCNCYDIYGGRGIKVCEEWSMDNVEAFAKWAEENGYKDGLQIDRIDVNGNYEPSNCRWVTRKENARNTRTNRFVTVFGERMTLAEAVERYGQVSYKVTHRRMVRGMTLEEALFTPKMNHYERTK